MIYATGVKHVAKFWLRSPDDMPEIERRVAELATLPEVIDMIVGPPLDTDWSGARYVLRPRIHRDLQVSRGVPGLLPGGAASARRRGAAEDR